MPNIPNVPGVPALSSYSGIGTVLLVTDAISFLSTLLFGTGWGIYLDGEQAFAYNSILDFDFKQDWPISDAPQEEGAFVSYDKVQLPFDVRVRVVSGGSPVERQALLTSVLAAANTLELYEVVTPELTYANCNVTHVDYKRTSVNGVGVIVCDIWFQQIRVTSTANFTNTQEPGIAGQQNTGSVSTQQPSREIQNGVVDSSGNSLVQ